MGIEIHEKLATLHKLMFNSLRFIQTSHVKNTKPENTETNIMLSEKCYKHNLTRDDINV